MFLGKVRLSASTNLEAIFFWLQQTGLSNYQLFLSTLKKAAIKQIWIWKLNVFLEITVGLLGVER